MAVFRISPVLFRYESFFRRLRELVGDVSKHRLNTVKAWNSTNWKEKSTNLTNEFPTEIRVFHSLSYYGKLVFISHDHKALYLEIQPPELTAGT